jgi:DNA primase
VSLSPQFLDELRARTLLSALIGRTTKLQKAGREYRACCPFHNEKSPSFYVNDDKGFYHCFGCSAHGDAIRWLTDQRSLPFMDAVKELAQSAGMDMPAMDPRAAEKAEAAKGLHEACADAALWFTDQLNGIAGAEARTVLEKRGIKPETARAFALGYAPDSRTKLKDALKVYGDPMLIEAGLLISVEEKTPYDRFRGRLMIPIRDPRGRTVAFGGRIIGDGEPKYLNSPETPLFDKGRTLYNLDRAGPAARKAGRVLVVEGYMDVIALAQAGFEEAVAPLGTALTEAQLERLWRMSDVPILCLDGDAPGQKAAIRAAHRALPMLAPGRSLAFVTLPQGQDPDDVIHSGGKKAFETLLSKAQSIEEFLWRIELAGTRTDTPDGRALLKQRLEQRAQEIAHPDLQREYKRTFLKRYFDLFGIKRNNAEAINEAVAKATRNPGRGLEYALGRAVLLGVMRHPRVLHSYFDEIFQLKFNDRYLNDWKLELLELPQKYNELTEDLVEQIIAQTKVAPIDLRNYEKDLAFSFYRKSSDPLMAEADLKKVLDLLNEEYEAKIALDLARQAFVAETTEERFAEQTRCQLAAIANQTSLVEWLERAAEAAEAA